MTSKFEQLIEYVINDEEGKARELFHDIVVEKSREIYENLMNEEEGEEELDEAKEEDAEGEELDESEEDSEEELDEGALGGDASDDLIDDVEMEEEGMYEGEGEEESEEGLEDRVVDLEDKLDELMAEFEALMGDEAGEEEESEVEFGDMEGDALEMDDTEDMDAEEDTEEFDLSENVQLKAAPAPVKSEPAGTNTKATTAFNSGAAGMEGAPVKMTGDVAKGRPAPSTKELIGKVGNSPAQSTQKPTPATKPVTTQAAGVNTKTPFPKG